METVVGHSSFSVCCEFSRNPVGSFLQPGGNKQEIQESFNQDFRKTREFNKITRIVQTEGLSWYPNVFICAVYVCASPMTSHECIFMCIILVSMWGVMNPMFFKLFLCERF